MLPDPVTALIIGIGTGVAGVSTYTVFTVAQKIGPQITISDLRPCLPWEGLPLPRFVYTKPELLAELRRR